jgi:hypothetical protein
MFELEDCKMVALMRTAVLLVAGFMAGCGGGSGSDYDATGTGATTDSPPVAEETIPFQELYDQGVDRYLGIYTPMSSEVDTGGAVLHSFGEGDGPLCYTGNHFSMSTRDGMSDELLIFIQGGGFCSSEACEAVDEPIPLFNVGLLSNADPTNPAADFNVGYVPYCDGTFFTGDLDVDSDGDGLNDRFFRGIHNLSASLDVIASTYPSPRRIVLAGNSAGGYGVHNALPLVRLLYPDVPIDLINDSGMGIQPPGGQESLNAYWNADSFYPESCDTCIGEDGNLTDYHSYQLSEDANLRMGFISSTADDVVLSQSSLDQPTFESELRAAVIELEEMHPIQFRSLIAENQEHTFILRQFDFPIGDTTVREWVTRMLDGDASWVSVTE